MAPPTLRRLELIGILALALLLRILPLGAGLPYLGYVDEGHVLHPVITLLKSGGWDPGTYLHPSLTVYMITGLAQLTRPVYVLLHGHSLIADLPASERYYDFVFPVEIIVLGRLLILTFSVATVMLVFILAARLSDRRTAILAGLLAALCPALVTRASVVIIDSVSAFFALAALLFAHRLESPQSGRTLSRGDPLPAGLLRDALLAGAFAGLAFISKYTIGVVSLAVAFTILTRPSRLEERIRLLIVAAGGAMTAAVIGMPALVFRFRSVWAALLEQSRLYSNPALIGPPSGEPGYLGQALRSQELGLPLIVAACCGFGWMLVRPATRRTALAWLLFTAALLATLLSHEYQKVRNVLPLIPPAIIAASLPLAKGISFRSRGGRLAALAATVVTGSLSLALVHWIPERLRLVDTRTTLVNWLASQTSRNQRVLLLEELAVLPSELERIPAIVRTVPWLRALDAVRTERFDYVVAGDIDLTGPAKPGWTEYRDRLNDELSGMTLVGSAGQKPTPVFRNLWRQNDELIKVLKAPRLPSPEPRQAGERAVRAPS